MGQNATRALAFPFEKLEVWRLAVDLTDFIFCLLETIPPSKHLRIVSQMEAAVTGIAQNIARRKVVSTRKSLYSSCIFRRVPL